jgi:hypothetical protein
MSNRSRMVMYALVEMGGLDSRQYMPRIVKTMACVVGQLLSLTISPTFYAFIKQ